MYRAAGAGATIEEKKRALADSIIAGDEGSVTRISREYVEFLLGG